MSVKSRLIHQFRLKVGKKKFEKNVRKKIFEKKKFENNVRKKNFSKKKIRKKFS